MSTRAAMSAPELISRLDAEREERFERSPYTPAKIVWVQCRWCTERMGEDEIEPHTRRYHPRRAAEEW